MTTSINTLVFTNLFAAIVAEKEKEHLRFITGLNEYKTVDEIKKVWLYETMLTPAMKKKQWANVEDLKAWLIAKDNKSNATYLDKKLVHLDTVANAADLVSITCSVEWKKNRTWGSNPNCSARVIIGEYNANTFESGSIGGCGYDKNSTAIANAVNQSNSFLKAMYLVKEQRPNVKNAEVFGYGSGYGILPHLEGGVGESCYRQIFETIGFTWRNSASGKSFDVYTATKN